MAVKESEKGVSFKMNEYICFFKIADNSLWVQFNLMRKTVEVLEELGLYKKCRGYGECYNFINPKYLKTEMHVAIEQAYITFLESIHFSKSIYHSLILTGFEIDLLNQQSICKLYKIDLASDNLEIEAPDLINNLKFGFKMNNDLCYSYEDDQLRGICAHLKKRDGKHGQKLFRMYLKTSNIIRYESCFNKDSAGKFFPTFDLSFLTTEELKNCIEPVQKLSIESFNQIQQDSEMEKPLSTESSRYEILKRILTLLEGNIGKGNLIHISNLIEHGYIQSRIVQDYRLIKKLKDNHIIKPAHQFRNNQRIGQYRLNTDFLHSIGY